MYSVKVLFTLVSLTSGKTVERAPTSLFVWHQQQ